MSPQRHTLHSRARGAAFESVFLRTNLCQFFKQRDPAHILSLRLSHPFRTNSSGVHAYSRHSVRCYPYRFCTCIIRGGLASKISTDEEEIPPCRRCFVVESERFVSVLDHDRRRKHR